MKYKHFNRTVILIGLLSLLCVLMTPVTSLAAGAEIILSSDKALYKSGEEIIVDVEISSQEMIGTYFIQMEYDTERMIYVSGADSENEGMMILTGTGLEETVRYELHFQAAGSGSGGIYIVKAIINSARETGKLTPSYEPVFEILVSGNSSSDTFATMVENGKFITMTGLPAIGSIRDNNDSTMYILDHFKMVPDEVGWDYCLTGGVFEGTELAFITDQQGNIHILCLTDNENRYYLFAVGQDDQLYPVIKFTDNNGNLYYVSSVKGCLSIPDNISSDEEIMKYAVYAIDTKGNGQICYVDREGNINEIDTDPVKPWLYLAVIIVILIAGILAMFVYMNRSRGKKKKLSEKGSVYIPESPDEYGDTMDESGTKYMKTELHPYSHEEIFEKTSGQGHKFIYVADVAGEETEVHDNKEIIPRKKIEAIMADEIE